VRSHSETDARLFGRSNVSIDYYEHAVEPAAATAQLRNETPSPAAQASAAR
jgi:hypothetical protein